MLFKRMYIVVVHMPHKSIVCPFSNRAGAYQYFCKLLLEASKKYGSHDMNGASLEHCRKFGRYEIKHGYFLQFYEAELDEEETILWLDADLIKA